MKKLTKIKLINWHLYNDASIEVKNNIVICGDNGSGKSTLIDAIHYVISAGTCKFNTAANERNDRTIESYVRGKLGFENKNCLRNSDVVSHVALEFFDDLTNSYSVVGSVIYVSIGSKVEKHFYHIMNSFIVDENYYKEKDGKKVPVNLTELSNNYRIKNSKEINEFQGNQEKIRNDLLNSLGLVRQDAKTYLELLPKALAFKPFGNINSFVFDYLLPQKTLDLETMKVSVRKYRDIRQIIENEKQKLSL
ncbi:MAG: ATP-binding protein, partial [bacterium]|nr:ATP-binding protein [bacterium]